MKLIDLISVIKDNTNVRITFGDFFVISEYDGKNSIDAKYNNCEVLSVEIVNDKLYIDINIDNVD